MQQIDPRRCQRILAAVLPGACRCGEHSPPQGHRGRSSAGPVAISPLPVSSGLSNLCGHVAAGGCPNLKSLPDNRRPKQVLVDKCCGERPNNAKARRLI
jgi:hypothetical protein